MKSSLQETSCVLWCKIAKVCSCYTEGFINSTACICNALQVIDCKIAGYYDRMLTINLSVKCVRHDVQVS